MNFGTNGPVNVLSQRKKGVAYTNNTPFLQISCITLRGSGIYAGVPCEVYVNNVVVCKVLDSQGLYFKKTVNIPVPPYSSIKVVSDHYDIESWNDIHTIDIDEGYTLKNMGSSYTNDVDYYNDTGGDQFIILACSRRNSNHSTLIVDGIPVGVYVKGHAGWFPMHAIIPNGSVWRVSGTGANLYSTHIWSR